MSFDFPAHFAARIAQFEAQCAHLRRTGQGADAVVFLGDSQVECYRGQLPWVNRGVISDHLTWPHGNVFDRLGSGRLHPNPLAIVTLIGINDVCDAPDGVSVHANQYRHLLANLVALHPKARLAVIGVLPTRGPVAHLNGSCARLNAELVEVAGAHDALFWNLHERFFDASAGEAHRALVKDDGVHLTRAGYRVLTGEVRARAAQLTRARALPHLRPLRRPRVQQTAARAWELLSPALGLAWGRPADPTAAVDRRALGAHILAAYGPERWAHKAETGSDEELIAAHLVPELDFLCRYAATGSPVFRALYLGARASFFAHNPSLWKDRPDGLRGAFARDRALWLEALGGSPLRSTFEAVFAELEHEFPAEAPREVRLLFVGDCLLEDAELLLGGHLLRQGLLARVDFILSKNPLEQTRLVREHSSEAYAGVVYSPLSWDFDPEFRSFLEPALVSPQAVREKVETIWARVSATIRLLAESFEAPIYVHNTAAAVRGSDEVRRVVKALLTWPQRDFARQEFGRRIAQLLGELNRKSFHHLVLVDELNAVRGLRDDLTLGRMLHYTEAVHPAALSVEVSAQLAHHIGAAARLMGKKVVVCDLDNTLWDGVIGEGLGTRPQLGRQRVLKALKARGVLLAINSKNDPQNVRFEGGVLGERDFVASQISWDPKPVGMKRLRDALNLKLKDFVFIDDRSDERAMVSKEFPGLLALDPCAEDTWKLFEAWVALLGDDEGDRTQQYHERAQRERVVGGGEQPDPNLSAELFQKLELKADIRRATEADLKRVHELINRTNQWNLKGTRCTFNEVRGWFESPRHAIYTVRVRDTFGDMGVVCVCVAEFKQAHVSVEAFVLSCRVFGYGVETAMLEQLKAEAKRRLGAPRVRGGFVATAHNKPCASMYASHGFSREGEDWVFEGGAAPPAPAWLAVQAAP